MEENKMNKYKVVYRVKNELGDQIFKEIEFATIKSARASKKYLAEYMCVEGKIYEYRTYLGEQEEKSGWELIQQKPFGQRKWEKV